MATTISKLNIALVTTADGVRTGVDRGISYLGKLHKRVDSLALQGYAGLKDAALSTFGQVASGTMAAQVATAAWHKTVEEIGDAYDRIGERSLRAHQLGGTTQDLGRIQYLTARTTTLNDDGTFDALRAMQTRISNASINPDDTLNTTFGQLGLDAKELLALPLQERMLAIGEAINEIADAGQRSAMTAKLFEETGSAMVNAFASGRDGMKAFFDEYDALHGVISEEDAARVKEFNDSLMRLTITVEGLFERGASDQAPAMVQAIEAVTDAIIFARENAEAFANVWAVLSLPATWPFRLVYAAGEAAGAWGETAEAAERTAEAMKHAGTVDPAGYLAAQEAAEAAAKAQEEAAEKAKKAVEERLRLEEQAHDRLVQRAQSIRESLRDPFTEFAAELVDALDTVDEKVLSKETFDRFAMERGQSLLDQLFAQDKANHPAQDRGDTRGIGSIEAGSQAALSAIAQNDRRQQIEDARAREAAKQRSRMTEHLRRIQEILDNPRRSLETWDIR